MITAEKNNIDELKENSKNELNNNFNELSEQYTNKYDDKKGFSVDDLVKIIEAIKILLSHLIEKSKKN